VPLPVCSTGVIVAFDLQPDPQAWPGGALLAPGGAALQQDLAQACLALALRLTGLDPAGGFAGGGTTGRSRRPPPQQLEAAEGEEGEEKMPCSISSGNGSSCLHCIGLHFGLFAEDLYCCVGEEMLVPADVVICRCFPAEAVCYTRAVARWNHV
jgi:hypothetical protein